MLAQFEREVAEFSFEGCSGLVLDAGCGNGNILVRAMSQTSGKKPLKDRIRYVGLDFSRNMLGMAALRSKNAPVLLCPRLCKPSALQG